MSGHRIGYIRVSSLDQNAERQLIGIEFDHTFTDKASGKDMDRPQLQAALAYARGGDTFIVHSMDRLARNVEDMLRIVRELNSKGVSVEFIKENMTFDAGKDDPRSTLMFTMLSAFAQFERSLIKERQREGIALAKARGVYAGRKPCLTPEQVEEIRERISAGEIKAELAREYGISRESLYKHLRTGTLKSSSLNDGSFLVPVL